MYFVFVCVCVCLLCWLFCWATRWHSWLGHCATSQRSRVRFPIGSFWPYYGPEVDWASNRNEYQGYLLGGGGKGCQSVGLTMQPPSCADFVEILEASPSWSHKGMLYRWLYYSKGFSRLQQRSEHLDRWLSIIFISWRFSLFTIPAILWFIPCVILPSLCDLNPNPSASLLLLQP